MSLLTLLFTTIYIQIKSINSDEKLCFIDEGGSEKCELLEVMDHLSHLFEIKDHNCENKQNDNNCEHWKSSNQCEQNLQFMIFNCAKTCGYCHLINPKNRCKRHPNAPQTIFKDDLNKMFERIINDFSYYNPTVYSRDPWLVTLDDVFTAEQCNALIKYGGVNFRRSQDAGAMTGDEAKFESIISNGRTSYNDWCVDNCWEKPIIQSIVRIAENITQVPRQNSEFFQVLKYDVGQYYNRHHDYIYGHLDLPIGPRLYTFYIYLNDVEKGGGTKFHDVAGGITVKPKLGRVAIWPNVLNSDPFEKEMRTDHEALPVEKGVKYGANLWLHQFNFHDPFKILCTG